MALEEKTVEADLNSSLEILFNPFSMEGFPFEGAGQSLSSWGQIPPVLSLL